MNILRINLLGFLLLLTVSCSKSLLYKSVSNQTQCSELKGYWYNDKCWQVFEDDGIAKNKVDSIVSAQIKLVEQSTFVFDNQTYSLVTFLPLEQDKELLLIAVYGKKENYKTLIFPTGKKQADIENGVFESIALHYDGDVLSGEMDDESKLKGTATVDVIDIDNLDVQISGNVLMKGSGKAQEFRFRANEAATGAGNSHLEIKGNEAFLSGTLGTITYHQVKEMITNHPEVKTIVLTNISGSVNDAVNLHTAMLLHDNGFTTKVLSDSDIASGGVDLFCSGINRVVEKGAKIGVHSWCCMNDRTAREIPKEHPAHMYQLEYFTKVLGPGKGPSFYYYTLEAAAFDDIHYMSDEEIISWTVATEFIGAN